MQPTTRGEKTKTMNTPWTDEYLRNKYVTTTCGELFTGDDHAQLAVLVYRRFGRDAKVAAAAWRRMLQNGCTEEDFETLLQCGQTRGFDKGR